jgi:hypothetical protein
MKYTANGQHNRHFELFDEQNNPLGRIDYTSWFSQTVDIKLGDVTYVIKAANFWHTSLHVLKGDDVVAELKFNWAGNMIVKFEGVSYMFKPTFWHNRYTLFTEHEMGIITLVPDFKWAKMSFNYDIETDDNYTEGKNALLILILMYCCNHIHTRSHAAM